MNVMIDLCVIPIGEGVSVSSYVATCEKVIQDSGLSHQLHAYGTTIEGDWDAVFKVVKQCHEAVHRSGCVRISSVIKVGT